MGLFAAKGVTEVVGKSLDVVDKLIPDKDKKQEITSNIIQNEIVSGSSFVRNARPMVIYTGLALIILEFFGFRLLFLQLIFATKQMIDSSTQIFQFFLVTWSGICSAYVAGRTYEKAKLRLFKKV